MSVNIYPSNQFVIENNILIDIPKEIVSYSGKYYPKRGTLEEFNTCIHGKTKEFCYYYIKDLQALGTNYDRDTEKQVIPLKIGMKLSNNNYYTDFAKNVYEYNNNKLYLLVCHSCNRIYSVNLGFENKRRISMDVKTYFDAKREMTEYCYKGLCSSKCPLGQLNNGLYVNCITLEQSYPSIAEGIIQYYIDRKERMNKMTAKDLLKRLDEDDLDKVIIISDGNGWTNISKLSIDSSTITLFADESKLLTDE